MTIVADGFSISEVSARTGLSTHTLRYYERAGLMREPVGRAVSSHRRYSEADITWVAFLTRLRATGMPIATMREYAELARLGDSSSEARMHLLEVHRASVLAQLEDVRRSLAAIDHKIAFYRERTESS